MKKRLPKLTLRLESLRLLDGPAVSGGQTEANTCPGSCAPTCGNPPATAQVAARFATARACCV
jgi:hypothetical protein